MPLLDRSTLADLNAFSTILRHRSLRGAAIEMGVTASALSHAIRRLETRLNAKLLNRTTRSVAPTVLGLDLARALESGFGIIDDALRVAAGTQAEVLGEIRLNVPADAAVLLLQPALPAFAAKTPGTRLTVSVDNRPVDIVAEGFDAGIRYGDAVAQDMIAIPLTGALRWVLAASPAYLARMGRPDSPEDLQQHHCIRLMLGNNAVYRWELGDGAAMMRVDVPGMLTFNDTQTSLTAIRGGLGIGYVLEALIADDLKTGALEVVLPTWSSQGAGFCLYYPSRRQSHPALARLIAIMRRQWNDRTAPDGQAV
ncbi:LysR family transcriptional regulator [Acidisoma silvae]|uniref:LysR family transcriptional regulator n=1 Tax=Acidisoma silvae TaxID=2802396 RepID=A0A964DY43_9PROT|nr:LysR family transcriptional regulator [Acidisoma silvae]MCB8874876.1 LysR family transcriptional regulator [Acidisoma silvae]